MPIEDSLPSISDLINSPLSKYITLAANDCGYDGTVEELIVSYVHPLFLRAHSAASKLGNPGWREANRGKFADGYWKAMTWLFSTVIFDGHFWSLKTVF
jgi:hypothetical protein